MHNYTFIFYKNNFIRTRGSFLLKIKEQIKNNPSLQKNKVANFQSQKYILHHAYSRTMMLQLPAAREQTKTSFSLFDKLA